MTYSIVARDPKSGTLGVAVQSHFLGTGSIVTWARPGVGAVATQAMARVAYGPELLDLLGSGGDVQEALATRLAADEACETRQVAAVDAQGRVAVHTGAKCIAWAGHRTGEGWTVQANMMLTDTVPAAMADAFVATEGDELAFRLLTALDAAEAAGGDIRGRQSAALVIVDGDPGVAPWERHYDLRVEDHPDPLVELRRLTRMHHAYRAGAWQDEVLGDNPELVFWHAVQLGGEGRLDEARDILVDIYRRDDRWRELLRRLPAAGILPDDPQVVARLADD